MPALEDSFLETAKGMLIVLEPWTEAKAAKSREA